MSGATPDGVVRFHDTHPIDEEEILAKLRAAGIDPATLTQAELGRFDQDHYDARDRAYGLFVSLYLDASMGGVRMLARRG